MAESLSVSGPVSIQSDCKQRVAFDLMDRISRFEDSPEKKSRAYWIKLYTQCHDATSGTSFESIMKER
jgi:hypothetical protein